MRHKASPSSSPALSLTTTTDGVGAEGSFSLVCVSAPLGLLLEIRAGSADAHVCILTV